MADRSHIGSGLDRARKPSGLSRQEHEFMLAKQAQGVPLTAIAKALGRSLEALRRGIVIDEPGPSGGPRWREPEPPWFVQGKGSGGSRSGPTTTWRPERKS